MVRGEGRRDDRAVSLLDMVAAVEAVRLAEAYGCEVFNVVVVRVDIVRLERVVCVSVEGRSG